MFIEDLMFLDIVQCFTLTKITNSILNFKTNRFIILILACVKILLSISLFMIKSYLFQILAIFLFLFLASCLLKLKCKTKKLGQIFLYFSLIYFIQNGTCEFFSNNDKLQLFYLANPIYYIMFCVTIFIFYQGLFSGISTYLYKKKIISNFIYQTSISLSNRRINVEAFLDTGNSLYDKDCIPIILLNIFECEELFDCKTYTYLLLKQYDKIDKEKFFLNNVRTICGTSSLICFKPDKVVIGGEEINEKVYVALTNSSLNKSIKCGCLLHPKLFLN